MRKSKYILILFSLLTIWNSYSQSITNVQAKQEGTNIVVTYDLACDFDADLGLYMSEDGGTSYIGPLSNTMGDVGKGITSGSKKVVWNVLAEKDMFISKNVSFYIKGTYNPNGLFTDSRDGQKYKIVQIGSQIWMAENLKYNSPNSICNSLEQSNCDMYGKMYKSAELSSVCPTGWHIPSEKECEILFENIYKTDGGISHKFDKLIEKGFDIQFGGYGYDGYNHRPVAEMKPGMSGAIWYISHKDNFRLLRFDKTYGIVNIEHKITFDRHYYSVRCLKN